MWCAPVTGWELIYAHPSQTESAPSSCLVLPVFHCYRPSDTHRQALLLPNHKGCLSRLPFLLLLQKTAEFKDPWRGNQDLLQRKTGGLTYFPVNTYFFSMSDNEFRCSQHKICMQRARIHKLAILKGFKAFRYALHSACSCNRIQSRTENVIGLVQLQSQRQQFSSSSASEVNYKFFLNSLALNPFNVLFI